MRTRHALTVAAAISIAACSLDASLFSEGEAIGGDEDDTSSSSGSGNGSSSSSQQSSSSSSGPSASTATTTSTTSTGGNAGNGGTGGTGGGTGGSTNCTHDPCDEGAALDSTCNDCTTAICNQDPYCCTDTWDYLCTYAVAEICQQDCNPSLPSCEDQHQNNQNVGDLCGENGEVCSLSYGGTTCSSVCFDAGTECLNVYDNAPSTDCDQAQALGCNMSPQKAICICSRGCGNNPPCTGGQVCIGGQCL